MTKITTQVHNIFHTWYIISFTIPSYRHTTSKLFGKYTKWLVLKLGKAPFHLFQQFTVTVSHHQHNSRLQHKAANINTLWTMHVASMTAHVTCLNNKCGKLVTVISQCKYNGMSSGVRQCVLQHTYQSTQNHMHNTIVTAMVLHVSILL